MIDQRDKSLMYLEDASFIYFLGLFEN